AILADTAVDLGSQGVGGEVVAVSPGMESVEIEGYSVVLVHVAVTAVDQGVGSGAGGIIAAESDKYLVLVICDRDPGCCPGGLAGKGF
ncbi:unnamed protein product, partial [marine sediment metagenome]